MEELEITVSRDVCIPLNMTDSDIICKIDRYPFASFMSPSVKVCIFILCKQTPKTLHFSSKDSGEPVKIHSVQGPSLLICRSWEKSECHYKLPV